jgi:L-cysteine S-thiosulfotransferase
MLQPKVARLQSKSFHSGETREILLFVPQQLPAAPLALPIGRTPMRTKILSGAALIMILAAACTPARKSSAGFHLPDGDPERGKAVFVEMKCYSCHRVPGVEGLDLNARTPVTLGGRVRYTPTDGQIATSIIEPSYRMAEGYRRDLIEANGRSLMPDTTHAMTVRQMIDLVAFLQANYQIESPPPVH